ncbi:hypothetical protein DYB31_011669 [Aphanomyces astaci]|uniref:Uncharacterized protein n=1 Tax=Aphanomyces astaci TaxID=112090 RepID=A0A397EW29_APHAT|nr:hypothetical protein DYB31_011669 [Aphanomyces astaci]
MEEDTESEVQASQRRKTAFRFKGCTDVELLKEVIYVRPYEAPHGEVRKRWTEVTEHLQRLYGDGITVNATRKRFDDLMTAFNANTMAALRAFGTDEEYDEREQLLQDIHDLVDAASIQKQTDKEEKAKQNERRETNGEKIRDAAIRGSSQRVGEAGVVVASLVEMVAKTNDVKAEEVRAQHENNMLAQKKLELDEKRYELDKAEREARFALERREREAQLDFSAAAKEQDHGTEAVRPRQTVEQNAESLHSTGIIALGCDHRVGYLKQRHKQFNLRFAEPEMELTRGISLSH